MSGIYHARGTVHDFDTRVQTQIHEWEKYKMRDKITGSRRESTKQLHNLWVMVSSNEQNPGHTIEMVKGLAQAYFDRMRTEFLNDFDQYIHTKKLGAEHPSTMHPELLATVESLHARLSSLEAKHALLPSI